MAAENDGVMCPACGEGTLHDGIRRMTYSYRGHTLNYEQPGAWCDNCDEGLITGREGIPIDEKLQAFEAQINAQEAEAIKRIRKRLHLTQKQAAKIAGGGVNAFSRYERGETVPTMAVINLFHLLDKHPDLLKELLAD